ncbi:LuxR C-terminal-related transcriptional regulator [Microbacterium sp. BK668]|uniref:LuxR C-terminal-related transcriptional regulator n=1 Tax=Microbacterium sp. BK668 TaxID=2512118 RepID=UPI00105C6F84|nr:LuxR C-terminal-related transcriptional regulator [Microbacterium sp. BK668]TDN90997.1 LuxR family maltose regulon positive regulatory protein [Microbacterium sp. BK668]
MTLQASALSSRTWTRHQPPTRQPVSLPRPALLDLLDEMVDENPVTIVTAPSGFGKTTVVSNWAERTSHLVAWLALAPTEEHAVDGAVIAAIESIVPPDRIGVTDPFGLVGANEKVDLHHRLEAALAGMLEPFVLVIDDAQRAGESLEFGLLADLIEHPPQALRVVLVGTTSLELRMPRFVLSHPEAVIAAEALAFERPEIEALAVAMESHADAALVHADTGGWPIAVRLALLTPRSSRSSAAVRTSGLMHEYVRDVVLSGLDPDLAEFVIEASVCDELTPEFASALTGRSDGGRMLERCRRLGLFLERTEGLDGPLYRWHSLFARHCRELLAEERPERLAALRALAGELLAVTRPLEAVAHLVALGDAAGAEKVILNSWVALVALEGATDLDRACLSLPQDRAESPVIHLIRACARDVIGEHRWARELFDAAEAGIGESEIEQRTLEIARLFFVDGRDRIGPAIAAVRARLLTAGTLTAKEHAALTFVLGWSELRLRASTDRTIETLEAAVREAEAVGDRSLTRRAREVLIYALVWAGRNTAARVVLATLDEDDADATSWVAYVGGSGVVAAGLLAYWAHDLEAAELELRRVLVFGRARSTFADLARIYLAATAAATGDPRQCRRAALELQFLPRSEVQGVEWAKFRQVAVALLEEAIGHRERALELVRGLGDSLPMPVVAVHVAGVLRRAGAYTEALQVLRNLKGFAGVSYVRVATFATNALAHWANGQLEAAHELCEQALEVADAELIRFPFAEDDPDLRELLGAHVAWGTEHEEFLLSCLRPTSASSALTVLSERERDVFEQLRTTLTTVEIAERLGVSVNTVKTHQRSIYRKLGVTSRREALRRYT